MLCPKCGAQLSDSAVICRACGAMLPEQPAATQVPYPPASQPAETAASAQPNAPRTCAQCGARFCTVCGMPAPEAPQGQADWYAPAPGGTVSSPEIGPKHKPKKLLIGLLCGFAALVVIVAVVAGIFAARQASAPSTAGGAEVDRLIDRYFTCFENDDPDAMLDLFLPEVIAYMQDDDTVTGREDALIQLDDWYYDYGKAIDDYYVYDDDSLDASDVRELQRELGVRIDDNVIVACDVEYRNGQDNDFYFEFVQVDGQWYLLFVVE